MKKIVILILILNFVVMSTFVYGESYQSQYEDYANKLKEIGVFKGTDLGFELDREPTRVEAAVMFVRLLGAEQEAQEMKYDHPFTDVPEWASDHVGYLYNKGLTNGTSTTTFGSYDNMSAKSYMTFILRSLGYDDSSGDFSWDQSLEFAKDNELIDGDNYNELNENTFLRDHVAKQSYLALTTKIKESDIKLLDKLVEIGAISEDFDLNIESEDVDLNTKMEDVNWFYFINEEDDCLYKITTDGTNKTKLTNSKSFFYEIVGEWIYYYGDNGNIYKMDLDGDNKTKINDDESGWINVVGEWIYYSNYDDNDNIYKIKTNGSNKTKLNEERSYRVEVVDEWIYYVYWTDSASMYKMKTDGSEKAKVLDNKTNAIVGEDEWIYYVYSDRGMENISKMKTDGNNKTLLETSNELSIILIEDEWIYYRVEDEDEDIWAFYTYKMKTDGSDKTKISDEDMLIIGIDGEWIYYQLRDELSNIYKINKDETGRQIVE